MGFTGGAAADPSKAFSNLGNPGGSGGILGGGNLSTGDVGGNGWLGNLGTNPAQALTVQNNVQGVTPGITQENFQGMQDVGSNGIQAGQNTLATASGGLMGNSGTLQNLAGQSAGNAYVPNAQLANILGQQGAVAGGLGQTAQDLNKVSGQQVGAANQIGALSGQLTGPNGLAAEQQGLAGGISQLGVKQANTAEGLGDIANKQGQYAGTFGQLSSQAGDLSEGLSNYQGQLADQNTALSGAQGQLTGTNGVLSDQQKLGAALLAQSKGEGPNPAQAQFQQNANQLAAQQAGAVASTRGINPALRARLAAQTAGAAGQNISGAAATLEANQQLAAQNQLAANQAAQATTIGQNAGLTQAQSANINSAAGLQQQQAANKATQANIENQGVGALGASANTTSAQIAGQGASANTQGQAISGLGAAANTIGQGGALLGQQVAGLGAAGNTLGTSGQVQNAQAGVLGQEAANVGQQFGQTQNALTTAGQLTNASTGALQASGQLGAAQAAAGNQQLSTGVSGQGAQNNAINTGSLGAQNISAKGDLANQAATEGTQAGMINAAGSSAQQGMDMVGKLLSKGGWAGYSDGGVADQSGAQLGEASNYGIPSYGPVDFGIGKKKNDKEEEEKPPGEQSGVGEDLAGPDAISGGAGDAGSGLLDGVGALALMAAHGAVVPKSLAFALMKMGGEVRGKAKYPGDNKKNDTVPALLSPDEGVLPRSVMLAPDAPERAKAFVEQLEREHGKAKSYGDVLKAKRRA